MKRTLAFIIALTGLAFLNASAQNIPVTEEVTDTLTISAVSAVDSTLAGETIYSVMSRNVSIRQSPAIRTALASHISRNADKMVSGYRIRIFFDNKQNSREASAAAMVKFHSRFPDISAYRSFANPFFKVTVGDYRTKAEAQAALRLIQSDFPTAFIVKEKFKFPCLQ